MDRHEAGIMSAEISVVYGEYQIFILLENSLVTSSLYVKIRLIRKHHELLGRFKISSSQEERLWAIYWTFIDSAMKIVATSS